MHSTRDEPYNHWQGTNLKLLFLPAVVQEQTFTTSSRPVYFTVQMTMTGLGQLVGH